MVFDKPSEYRGVTLTYDHWEFVKKENLSLRHVMADAIDKAMCKKTIMLDKECIEWIDSTDMNFDMFVRNAIYNEMKNNGR